VVAIVEHGAFCRVDFVIGVAWLEVKQCFCSLNVRSEERAAAFAARLSQLRG
jgi:hypothetical protein